MKVMNIGSVNLDYVYRVPHLATPGETLSADERIVNLGGKGLNQSVALARAGLPPEHACIIGKEHQHLILEAFKAELIGTSLIEVADAPSGHAIIQVDMAGENSIVLYGGTNKMLTHELIDRFLASLDAEDVLILQNEVNELAYIVDRAHSRGIQVVLNPSPVSEALKQIPLEKISWLILNEVEGYQLTGKSETDEILESLLSSNSDLKIVLTLGHKGSIYADSMQRVSQEAIQTEVVDTTGAGDTFTGYFLASALMGESIKTSLERASLAASIAVSRQGAMQAIPYKSEV